METIGSRVRRRRVELGLTQKELGDLVGMTQQGVYSMETNPDERRRPRLVNELARVLGVSIEWLIEGKGEKSTPGIETRESNLQSQGAAIRQTFQPHVNFEHSQDQLSEIVEIDPRRGGLKANVGDEMEYTPIDKWLFPAKFTQSELHVEAKHALMVEVIGDAMAPTLLPGDRVLVDTDDTDPEIEALYAILSGKKTIIRRLEPITGSDPVMVSIVKDRDRDRRVVETVPLSSLVIVGRVVMKLSKV